MVGLLLARTAARDHTHFYLSRYVPFKGYQYDKVARLHSLGDKLRDIFRALSRNSVADCPASLHSAG